MAQEKRYYDLTDFISSLKSKNVIIEFPHEDEINPDDIRTIKSLLSDAIDAIINGIESMYQTEEVYFFCAKHKVKIFKKKDSEAPKKGSFGRPEYRFRDKKAALPQEKEPKKPPGIGTEDFKYIVKKHFYIDKTDFIKELNDRGGGLFFVFRPSRFGKSTLLSMLNTFYGDQDGGEYFDENNYIQQHKSIFQTQGQQCVIHLSFKNLTETNQASFLSKFHEIIKNQFTKVVANLKEKHSFNGAFEYSDNAKELLFPVEKKLPDEKILKQALYIFLDNLKELKDHLDKPIIPPESIYIFIDEFDMPIIYAEKNSSEPGYKKWLIPFLSNVLSTALKTSNQLYKATILTGTSHLKNAKVLSHLLGNAQYSTLLSPLFNSSFGFTNKDIDELLENYGLEDKKDLLLEWFGNIRSGQTLVYHPQSILKAIGAYIHGGTPPLSCHSKEAYLNFYVTSVFEHCGEKFRKMINTIYRVGKSGSIDLSFNMPSYDLTEKNYNDEVWCTSILVAGGLLSFHPVVTENVGEEPTGYEIYIPNHEAFTLIAQNFKKFHGISLIYKHYLPRRQSAINNKPTVPTTKEESFFTKYSAHNDDLKNFIQACMIMRHDMPIPLKALEKYNSEDFHSKIGILDNSLVASRPNESIKIKSSFLQKIYRMFQYSQNEIIKTQTELLSFFATQFNYDKFDIQKHSIVVYDLFLPHVRKVLTSCQNNVRLQALDNYALLALSLAEYYLYVRCEFDLAETYYESAKKSKNNPPDTLAKIYSGLGKCYYRKNEFTKAEKHLLLSIKSTKNNLIQARARYRLAKLYWVTLRIKDAIRLYNEVKDSKTKSLLNTSKENQLTGLVKNVELRLQYINYFYMGRGQLYEIEQSCNDHIDYYDKEIQLQKENPFVISTLLFREYALSHGNIKNSIENFDEMCNRIAQRYINEEHPEVAKIRVHQLILGCVESQKQINEYLKKIKKIFERIYGNTNDNLAFLFLELAAGCAYQHMGGLVKAADHFNIAKTIERNFVDSHGTPILLAAEKLNYERGINYHKSGYLQKAKEAFDIILDLELASDNNITLQRKLVADAFYHHAVIDINSYAFDTAEKNIQQAKIIYHSIFPENHVTFHLITAQEIRIQALNSDNHNLVKAENFDHEIKNQNVSLSTKDEHEVAKCYYLYGRLHLYFGRISIAKKFLLTAIQKFNIDSCILTNQTQEKHQNPHILILLMEMSITLTLLGETGSGYEQYSTDLIASAGWFSLLPAYQNYRYYKLWHEYIQKNCTEINDNFLEGILNTAKAINKAVNLNELETNTDLRIRISFLEILCLLRKGDNDNLELARNKLNEISKHELPEKHKMKLHFNFSRLYYLQNSEKQAQREFNSFKKVITSSKIVALENLHNIAKRNSLFGFLDMKKFLEKTSRVDKKITDKFMNDPAQFNEFLSKISEELEKLKTSERLKTSKPRALTSDYLYHKLLLMMLKVFLLAVSNAKKIGRYKLELLGIHQQCQKKKLFDRYFFDVSYLLYHIPVQNPQKCLPLLDESVQKLTNSTPRTKSKKYKILSAYHHHRLGCSYFFLAPFVKLELGNELSKKYLLESMSQLNKAIKSLNSIKISPTRSLAEYANILAFTDETDQLKKLISDHLDKCLDVTKSDMHLPLIYNKHDSQLPGAVYALTRFETTCTMDPCLFLIIVSAPYLNKNQKAKSLAYLNKCIQGTWQNRYFRAYCYLLLKNYNLALALIKGNDHRKTENTEINTLFAALKGEILSKKYNNSTSIKNPPSRPSSSDIDNNKQNSKKIRKSQSKHGTWKKTSIDWKQKKSTFNKAIESSMIQHFFLPKIICSNENLDIKLDIQYGLVILTEIYFDCKKIILDVFNKDIKSIEIKNFTIQIICTDANAAESISYILETAAKDGKSTKRAGFFRALPEIFSRNSDELTKRKKNDDNNNNNTSDLTK